MSKKFRVVVCRNFPDGEPMVIEVNSLKEAVELHRRCTHMDIEFQSDQDVDSLKPGCKNIVMIEQWDEEEGDWVSAEL